MISSTVVNSTYAIRRSLLITKDVQGRHYGASIGDGSKDRLARQDIELWPQRMHNIGSDCLWK